MEPDAVIHPGPHACFSTAPSPRIDVYRATGRDSGGASILIFPGGGYARHAPHEGVGYARFLVHHGYTCFVAHYRVGSDGHRHPAMLEDAAAAMACVRARAQEFGGSAECVGVMGSSAGGHLAAHLLTSFTDFPANLHVRPDFGILCYPVISCDPGLAHEGSIANLLGERAEELRWRAAVSCERLVTAQTPPCFLWHTVEDTAVPVGNSLRFAEALGHHEVPYELHIYPKGRHGLGMNTELPWPQAMIRWLGETLAT